MNVWSYHCSKPDRQETESLVKFSELCVSQRMIWIVNPDTEPCVSQSIWNLQHDQSSSVVISLEAPPVHTSSAGQRWALHQALHHDTVSSQSVLILHVWQRAAPPPPAAPSRSSCPPSAGAAPARSAAAAGPRAASPPPPQSRPRRLGRPLHPRPPPPSWDCPEEHHLHSRTEYMKLIHQ